MSRQKAALMAQDQSRGGTVSDTGRHRPTCSLSLGSHPSALPELRAAEGGQAPAEASYSSCFHAWMAAPSKLA